MAAFLIMHIACFGSVLKLFNALFINELERVEIG